MPSIKRGITRTVILVGKWAIKVPRVQGHGKVIQGFAWSFSRGWSANLSEIQWSDYYAEDGYVCPLKFSLLGGLINVYPRCQPCLLDMEEVYDLPKEQAPFQMLNGPMDTKPQNLGWYQGKLVWIDYDMNWNDWPPCQPGCRPFPPQDEE